MNENHPSMMRREIDEAGDAAARQIGENADAIREWGRRLRALDPPVLATNARGMTIDHQAHGH